MSRFSFRDNVWSKWFPRFYHDHDTYRTEKLGGILERFVKICSEYFDDIMVDHTNEPGLDNIIELLDPDTTPELFMNYLWEFLGEIPYGYGLVIQNKEYNKDDITDWLRSDTYFRANSRKLLKYAISLYKIRGTQRFYQILGKFYYVRFTLIETENGGSPGEPLPLPTYDHLVIATFTQQDNQENVSYYPRGNGIQVRAGYPDGDCYSCLYYALIITVSSEEYDNWVSAGKVDVVKNTLVQIVERYLPVHCKLARYADNSLKVILEVEGVYTFAWSDYVCVQSEVRVLTGITSTFTQGSAIIYDTDNINNLKQYLTIIAEYSDGTSRELTNDEYTLIGTLTAPSSTITVAFENQTDIFTVQVTHVYPYDSLVEYLESNGTQYIDTGIIGDQDLRCEVEFMFHISSTTSGSGRGLGSRTSPSSQQFVIGTYNGQSVNDTTIFFGFGNSRYNTTVSPAIGTWHKAILDKNECTLDGTTYATPTASTFITPSNIKLFGFDNSGTIGKGKLRIKSAKFYSNNVLVLDLYSCRKNGVGYMYDAVSDSLLTNNGTFAYGNDV